MWLLGVELRHEAGAALRPLAAARDDLDLAFDDGDPRALVHLVLLELLALRELQRDDARGVGRGQDLRLVGLDLEISDVPRLHRDDPTRRLDRRRSIASASRSSGTVREILKKPSPPGP